MPKDDEDDQCAAQAPDTCGTTGLCAAGGQCERYADYTSCGDWQICFGGVCQQSWCDGHHTILRSTRPDIDCTPYLCIEDDDRCRESCLSNRDCVSGFVCSADGRCQALADASLGCAPACAVGTPSGSGRPWLLPLAVGLLVAARRRRSRRRPPYHC
ncbi:MAG: hypothetical protein JRI23_02705 [Deltaproteobacteria bacterium]|nr:hypothetical protein [Deltaproteobacteria bacterium]MBW2530411.1 hypothetical protein [Deltaproteobacteria bacterium]